ncbi:hypothetical protein SOVF_129690 [Spinacia oleracea]|nr:hypothetical protein SOVF_129690 [Spinacia oleracea]
MRKVLIQLIYESMEMDAGYCFLKSRRLNVGMRFFEGAIFFVLSWYIY